MNTVWTVDHRYGDASVGLRFIRIFKDFTEDPENFDINKYPDCRSYDKLAQKDKKAWRLGEPCWFILNLWNQTANTLIDLFVLISDSFIIEL